MAACLRQIEMSHAKEGELLRTQFDNGWVNNASTSFFTLFHSLEFIFTAYFALNYFIFTSYMKYLCLWSISIVTGKELLYIYHVERKQLCAKIQEGLEVYIVTVSLCHIVLDCVNRVSCVGRVWYVWAVGRKCEKNMTDSSQSRKWQTIVWSHYGAILDLLDNENNGSQPEVVLQPDAPPSTVPHRQWQEEFKSTIKGNNANVIQCWM